MKLLRSIKYFYQRQVRGCDDSELWSLDISLAKWLVPRLERFKDCSLGCPVDLKQDEWDRILVRMILGFKFAADDTFLDDDIAELHIKDALELLGQYYRNLWS